MRKNNTIRKNIDWFTILLFGILVFMGWLNIFAANYNEENASLFDFTQNYGKQAIFIITSLLLIFIVLVLDAQIFSSFAYPIYISGLIY